MPILLYGGLIPGTGLVAREQKGRLCIHKIRRKRPEDQPPRSYYQFNEAKLSALQISRATTLAFGLWVGFMAMKLLLRTGGKLIHLSLNLHYLP